MRLYFDASGLDKSKVASLMIYTSSSKTGTYRFVEKVTFDPLYDYVTVSSHFENMVLSWFKLSLVDAGGKESARSDAFLSDSTSRLITAVKASLGDTGGAFTDDEYITRIKEAVKVHFLTETIEELFEADVSFIEMLVKISCCYDLAFDNARYSRITLPDGISLDKGERVDHYLAIAKQLQARYDSLMGRIEGADGSRVVVTKLQKRNYFKRGF